MAFAVFGPGSLYVRRTDVTGSTPINIGYSQEFSLEETGENKELFGQKQYPLVVARGTIKVTGKAKAAEISAIALNNAFHGESSFTTGGQRMIEGEDVTPPANVSIASSTDTPSGSTITFASTTGVHVGMWVDGHANIADGTFVASFIVNTSVTLSKPVLGDVPMATMIGFHPGVKVAQAANFFADLGVLYATTGLPLAFHSTTAGLTAGSYYVDTTGGYYGFANADDVELLLNYMYTDSVNGQKLTITNKNIGSTPTFEIWYATTLNAKPYVLHIFQAVSSKLSQQFKLTDFSMPEIDFGIFANPAGKVYEASYPDVS